MRARVARVLTRPGASLLAVLLVVGGGLAAATTTAPEPPPRPASATPGREVPLARAGAACPDPVADEDSATTVAVAAPGAVGGVPAGRAGRMVVAALGGPVLPQVEAAAPGSLRHEVSAGAAAPLTVRGVDGSAPGLTAEQLTRSTNATMRGLAGLTCAASGTDAWFVGSGAVIGQRGRVYLTNTEPAPAVVDLRLYGPDGPIDAPDGRGVSIAPGGQEIRLLDALAPGVARFAIHVHARAGRVSAAVRDLQVEGLTPLGADWVPAAAAPARRQVVAGVPGGAGPRLLHLVAPGATDAIVRIRLLTPAGPVTPPGLDVVQVTAGTVAEVDVSPYTAGEPVAIELRSDAAVTAGLLARVAGAEGALGELAYAAAARPLHPAAPGVVAQARQGEAVVSTLLLSAPRDDATVDVRPLPPATGPGTQVHVVAGSTLAVDLATVSTDESFAFTVTPADGSGPVYAARQITETEARGVFVTSSPVEPGRYVVRVPRTVADLSTGLRLR